MIMKRAISAGISLVLVAVIASAQAVYQPKFKGDPARSDSEFIAIAYMKTFLRAQHAYKKKNGHYATTLMELTKTGSFTRRMANPDRGDYTVKFRDHKDKDEFEITMVPKQQDTTHRSFFSDQEGKIRASEQGEADESSPVLKADSD
jgi:type II secretory pathway pseudopilin PulG